MEQQQNEELGMGVSSEATQEPKAKENSTESYSNIVDMETPEGWGIVMPMPVGPPPTNSQPE